MQRYRDSCFTIIAVVDNLSGEQLPVKIARDNGGSGCICVRNGIAKFINNGQQNFEFVPGLLVAGFGQLEHHGHRD